MVGALVIAIPITLLVLVLLALVVLLLVHVDEGSWADTWIEFGLLLFTFGAAAAVVGAILGLVYWIEAWS